MSASSTRRMRRPRPRRRGLTALIILVVLIVLLVAIDFAAKAIAESKVASEIQDQGFPKKPSVVIGGFPFLTQVISRNVHSVTISSTNVPVGPLKISSVHAVMNGVHINSSFNGATVDNLTGTAKITFGALSNAISSQAGGLGGILGAAGLKLTPAGHDEVKASINAIVTSGSATWRVSKLAGNKLGIQLVSSSGLPSELLGSLQSFTVPLSGLPLHLQLDSVNVTPAGLVGVLGGQNLTFGG